MGVLIPTMLGYQHLFVLKHVYVCIRLYANEKR